MIYRVTAFFVMSRKKTRLLIRLLDGLLETMYTRTLNNEIEKGNILLLSIFLLDCEIRQKLQRVHTKY